jgi:serine/threonine-protein kinase
MDSARWERLQALFHAALDRPEAERAAFLDRIDDPALRADVEAMLAEDTDGTSPLDRSLGDLAHGVLDATPLPRTVGPYRVLRELGRGGSGVVYLAEREDLGRRVAVKVLRDATLSPARRARFEREERTLAALAHPAIARLYDADALPDGTPYFVMEYVEGTPLTAYCDEHDAGLPTRLRLFRAACEAVEHAHHQAVIHRDLKPSNILVTERDGSPGGRPAVKLLDFGIAKPLDTLDAPVEQTRGFRMMTPAYAAPEQFRGEPVGTYTDVYALGVLLYELLAGVLPYDLAGLTPGQAEARVLGEAPAPPSRRRAEAVLPFVVGTRAWADLDVLCLTAMHRDPERRYPTVDALVRDLDRFREGRPLEARPDSFGYRAGKFVRRHRRPLAAAAVVLAVVVGLVGFYTARLAEARDAALADAARTQRIQGFVLDLLAGGDGAAGPPDTLRVLTAVARGAHEARVLDGEPDLQAALLHTLGTVYHGFGDLERADTLLQSALAQRRALWGPAHPEVVRSLAALGALRGDQGRLDEAERLARRAFERARDHLPPGHPALAEALVAYGAVRQQQGDYDAAITLLAEAVRLHAARDPGPGYSRALRELADAHAYAGDYATSDSLNRRLLALNERLFGPRHPRYASNLLNLAGNRTERGYAEEAEPLYRQALDILLDYHGPDHPDVASALSLLGDALVVQERHDEAATVVRQALAARERIFGPDHPDVGLTLSRLGNIAIRTGDLDAADSLFSRQLAIYRSALGESHQWVGAALSSMASVHHRKGEPERAEGALRQALAVYEEALGPDHVSTAITRTKLGRLLVLNGRHTAAEPHLRAGYETLRAQTSPSFWALQSAREDLAAVCEATERPDEAARFRAEHAEAEAAPRG